MKRKDKNMKKKKLNEREITLEKPKQKIADNRIEIVKVLKDRMRPIVRKFVMEILKEDLDKIMNGIINEMPKVK